MSEPAVTAADAARRAGSLFGRVVRAWRQLPSERRLAAGACLGLFVTLFLPWYQETVVSAGKSASASLTGWAAFSFVEAAVLLVAAGVLGLLFARAEDRAFHLPGGDGGVVTAAGAWTCVLVIWRILDKNSVSVSGPGATASGVEFGIFAALAVAALLTYAGTRIRLAHTPEPPLPADDVDYWMTDGPERAQRWRERESRRGRRSGAAPARAAAPAATPGAGPAKREPRRRARRASSEHGFPAPEPLADPPTLRLGDMRPQQRPDAPLTDQYTDEQLTIPFDETDRPPGR